MDRETTGGSSGNESGNFSGNISQADHDQPTASLPQDGRVQEPDEARTMATAEDWHRSNAAFLRQTADLADEYRARSTEAQNAGRLHRNKAQDAVDQEFQERTGELLQRYEKLPESKDQAQERFNSFQNINPAYAERYRETAGRLDAKASELGLWAQQIYRHPEAAEQIGLTPELAYNLATRYCDLLNVYPDLDREFIRSRFESFVSAPMSLQLLHDFELWVDSLSSYNTGTANARNYADSRAMWRAELEHLLSNDSTTIGDIRQAMRNFPDQLKKAFQPMREEMDKIKAQLQSVYPNFDRTDEENVETGIENMSNPPDNSNS